MLALFDRLDPQTKARRMQRGLEEALPTPQAEACLAIWRSRFTHSPGLELADFVRKLEESVGLNGKMGAVLAALVRSACLPTDMPEEPQEGEPPVLGQFDGSHGTSGTLPPVSSSGPAMASAGLTDAPSQGYAENLTASPTSSAGGARSGPASQGLASSPTLGVGGGGEETPLLSYEGLDDRAAVFNHLLTLLLHRFELRDPFYAKQIAAHVRTQIRKEGLRPEAIAQVHQWCDEPEQTVISSELTTAEMASVIHVVYEWGCQWVGPVETDRVFGRCLEMAQSLPQASRFSPRQLF